MRKAVMAMLTALVVVGFVICSSAGSSPGLSEESIFFPHVPVQGMEFLFLRDQDTGVDDVAQNHASDFRSLDGHTVRFWNVEDSLWLRVPIAKLEEAARRFPKKDIILMLMSQYISRVDFFLPVAPGKFESAVHGLDVPVDRRSFPSRYPVFQLKGACGEEYAYLNVRTNIPIAFAVLMEEEVHFYNLFIKYLTWYMFFYSFLAALVLAYLFFYFMTRDRGYFIAVLHQTSVFFFLFAFNGYLQYYFQIKPEIVYILYWLALACECVAEAFLCLHLLQGSEPLLRRVLLVKIVTGVFLGAAAFSGIRSMTQCIAGLVWAEGMTTCVLAGILQSRRGYLSQIMFMISRLAFFSGVGFLLADVLLAEPLYLFKHLYMISFLASPIFLALTMIPGTRRHFENYFALEEQSLLYATLSQRDGVTGLYNKGHFMTLMDSLVQTAQRDKKPLAFIMMNIDHFQKFNDAWGYPEGDKMLLFLAKLIRQRLRESDIAAYYGNGEFSVVLPDGTLPSTVLVAERIRQAFEKKSGEQGEKKTLTLSIGLSFLAAADTLAILIQRANEALDRAKANGRNRTEFEVSP